MTASEARPAELLEDRVAQLEEELRKTLLDGEQLTCDLDARDERLKSLEALKGGNGTDLNRSGKVKELSEKWRMLAQENGSLKFSLKTRKEQLLSMCAAPSQSPQAKRGTAPLQSTQSRPRSPTVRITSSQSPKAKLGTSQPAAHTVARGSPGPPGSQGPISFQSPARPPLQLTSTPPGPSSQPCSLPAQSKGKVALQDSLLLSRASLDFGEDARVLRRLVEANDDLKAKKGWFNAAPSLENVSRWSGVTCAHGRVTELQVQVVVIPEVLGTLSSLVSLDLSSSESLTTLPASLGKLSALTSLKLSGCSSIEFLPASIGDCRLLSSVNLGGCKALRALPDTVGSLKALKRLDMWHCKQVKALPHSIGGLSSIAALSLRYCEGLTQLPEQISALPTLKTLDLCGCSGLAKLPFRLQDLPALRRLDLKGCTGLSQIRAEMLEHLRSQGCEVMTGAA